MNGQRVEGGLHVLGDWLLTPQRVAVHLPTATAIAADLHLGYDEARRAAGEAVPIVSLQRRLAPLAAVVARAARRLVIAGDLFEDGLSPAGAQELLDWAASVGVELAAVVPGNHDRADRDHATGLPLCPDGVRLGEWCVVHGDAALPPGRVVQGHLHPCLRRGRLAAPSFLVAAERIVLPAYSADARGVNVLHNSAWREFRCYAVAGAEVLDLGGVGRLEARLNRVAGGS
jgi:putative SbcD/Mre11-related phosphoesterase